MVTAVLLARCRLSVLCGVTAWRQS